MDKKILRNKMLVELNKMKMAEHKRHSQGIINRLLLSNEFKRAQTIGVTISRFPEVNTLPLIEIAWAMGKRIVVPKCIPSTRVMDFRTITSFDQMEIVYMDLQEPILSETQSVQKKEIDLLIVPGVVYSMNGYRIGFGGGYYDRYLSDYTGDALSLAFELQIGHTIPVESYDVPVKKIITEQRELIPTQEDEAL